MQTINRAAFRRFSTELPIMLKLAWPVIFAEIGWVMLGVVDTMVVGRVSAEALGAVSIGSGLHMAVILVGIGLLLGLDYKISHAHGAGSIEKCKHILMHGVTLAFILSLPLIAVVFILIALLPSFKIQAAVLPGAISYLKIASISILPIMLYNALRRYLQACSIVKPLAVTLIIANIFNAFANWVFVFGKFGFPAMGADGAAIATNISAIAIFVCLAIVVMRNERREKRRLLDGFSGFQKTLFVELLKLGFPAATQILFEVGIFTTVTMLAGRLAPISLAAHHIVLKIISFTFMIPLGLSSAGAVRVGQEIGRKSPRTAATAGWTAMIIGAGFMSFCGIILLVFPVETLSIFTSENEVIIAAVSLVLVAALFQLFDGVQVTAIGVLRGLGDTKTAMYASLICHWGFGVPIAYLLCFRYGWGLTGLWAGLCAGLISVAVVLLYVWRKKAAAKLHTNLALSLFLVGIFYWITGSSGFDSQYFVR